MKDKKIFIVEDDKNIRQLLERIFILEGAKATSFENGGQLLKTLERTIPDIILLDIMLPDVDGYSICKKILEKARIPVIMITAKSHIDDKIKGLELGADDYITKPFHVREVILRVNKLLQRYENTSHSNNINNARFLAPGITVYLDDYRVAVDGEDKKFSPREFELLKCLVERKGRIVTREQILDDVWGLDFYGDVRTVDLNIQRIRKKLGFGRDDNIIETVFGVGYRLNIPDNIDKNMDKTEG
ncbi:MAG TPA: response regulator transcription factor [Clostridiaceae bacterium]|jgi:DNA-binding response OmpR family regulator|nr:response regulator transcription factor [Clostridiaceae bacterium]